MAGIQSHTKLPSSKTDEVSKTLEASDKLTKNFVSEFECYMVNNKATVWQILSHTPFVDFHFSSPSLAIGPPQTKYFTPSGTNSSSSSVQNRIAIITDSNPWRTHICRISDEYSQLYSNLAGKLDSLKSPIKTVSDNVKAMQEILQVREYFVEVQKKGMDIAEAVSNYLKQEDTTSLPVIAGALTTPPSNGANHSKTEMPPKTEQGALTTPPSNGANHSKTEMPPKTEQGALTTPPSNKASHSKTEISPKTEQGALTTPPSNEANQSKTANPPPKKQGADRFLTLSERYQRFAALKSSDDDSDS